MNFSIYGKSDKKNLEHIAASVYGLSHSEYKLIPVEGDEERYALYAITEKIIAPIMKVSIAKDSMQASISLYPGINVEKQFTPPEVREFLKGFGIIDEFIKEDKIVEALKIFSKPHIVPDFPVVIGIPPVNGSKCVIEKMFEGGRDVSPLKSPGGSVNYKSISSFIIVNKGDLLLKRKPPTAGINGRNIRGEEVKAFAGEDKSIEAGEGVEVNDAKTEYRSKFNGHLVMSSSSIAVLPVLEISGDVDLRVGDVTFDGTVHVCGNVLPGFNINADNIIVDGIVENATLNAKSSIIIKTGRKGTGKGLIKAGTNISFGYCENGEVFAGGDVEIQKYCFNAAISAEKIYTSSKDSIISGGFLQAFSEVRVANLGSQSTNDMVVSVGISPTTQEKAEKVMLEINNINSSLQRISDIVKKIDMVGNDTLKDPKFRKLIDTVGLFKRRLPLLQKKYDDLMQKAVCEDPRIIVENKARSGVRIKISNTQFVIRSDMARVEFFFDKETSEIGFKNF